MSFSKILAGSYIFGKPSNTFFKLFESIHNTMNLYDGAQCIGRFFYCTIWLYFWNMSIEKQKKEYFEYLTIDDQIKNWGLYAISSGNQLIRPGSDYPKIQLKKTPWQWESGRVLNDFALVYVKNGTGVFESHEVGKKSINGATIILLLPGMWHRYKPEKNEGWEECWVVFNGAVPRRLLGTKILNAETPLYSVRGNEQIASLFLRMEESIRHAPVGYLPRISMGILQILAELQAHSKAQIFNGSHVENSIVQARIQMMKQLDGTINVRKMAQDLNVGYSWFRHKFKEFSGLPPNQYHMQLRINKAKRLLLGTDLSIKQIATSIGFSSEFYFSRTFKKVTGITASAFRDQA